MANNFLFYNKDYYNTKKKNILDSTIRALKSSEGERIEKKAQLDISTKKTGQGGTKKDISYLLDTNYNAKNQEIINESLLAISEVEKKEMELATAAKNKKANPDKLIKAAFKFMGGMQL